VLIIVVLLQSGKAADLAGAFGGAGSQTAFGPRGAASVLSQATTWCAIMFMVCALAMVVRVDRSVENGEGGGSILQQFSKPATKTTPAPANSAPAPATQQPAAPQSSAPSQPQPAPATPNPKKP
jgi:preprotein translocase subunit SecG